ncbi:putative chalcone synthase [Aspergillus nomiae NRRL 13137]|uniref:Putative chalcone synthase n=1 Tax=Aspergillus nomiae NRRL (strain ATCC 15546 / NRRL 13137 / CBS 260.88 / M93) TaxID=1509407 RepID=A0A0L1JI55_ASPN3|nr:putative chalcone synthase [Aspergillus nomiae NRRL 13137]KNG91083.1 putative chalcone synthase [Aspergillus nomiae NRRL 13137]
MEPLLHGTPPLALRINNDVPLSKRVVSVVGTGAHYPSYEFPSDELEELISGVHDPNDPAIRKTLHINEKSRIQCRYTAVPLDDPFWTDPKLPDVADCDVLFRKYGVPVAEEAARKALADWNGSLKDITHLVVVTCTNTANPGLDYLICERLGLHRNVQRTLLHGVGCAGGVSALRTANELLLGAAFQGRPGRALVVACEICTIFFRSMLEDIVKTQEANVAMALFGDGASAMVLSNGICTKPFERAPLWNILNSRTTLLEDSLSSLQFNIRPSGYNPVITKDVPGQTSAALPSGFQDLIASTPSLCSDKSNFDPSSYDWALHPGGYSIAVLAQSALGITKHHLRKTYDVYRLRGNTSSSTVISVINELAKEQDTPESGRDKVIVAAFGPGITMEMAVMARPT